MLVEEGGKFSQKDLIQMLNKTLLPYHELLKVFKNVGGIDYEQIDQVLVWVRSDKLHNI